MINRLNIDCIELQDREALRIHEALKNKTREEVLAYWEAQNEQARTEYPHLRVSKGQRGREE
jgi:hypothetical protein